MMLKIDLHLHTMFSEDSKVTFESAVAMCESRGLDGFAVCDHDQMTEIPHEVTRDTDLIIVPGVEVSAKGAHILAFDISKPIPKDLSISETVLRIHMQKGIAILAHPFSVFRTWVNRSEIIEANFDLIEVANAYQFPYRLMLSMNTKLAEELELPTTGGSDAHKASAVGKAYTVLDAETRDVNGVLAALREGKTKPEGRGVSFMDRLKLFSPS
jgi:predicted metal-dependent phosphoesterase TrpH